MIYIGIDPGISGSICWLTPDNITFLDDVKGVSMAKHSEHIVGIESQTYSPRQRGAGTNMFNYGKLIGHLEAYGLSYEKVAPRNWYKFYRISSGLAYSERKKATATIMGELYPEQKHLLYGPKGGLLDGRSDALAIAHFLREQHSQS